MNTDLPSTGIPAGMTTALRFTEDDLPARIHVIEVGPRDGFQMERDFISTDLKIRCIDQLGAAGLRTIEATSFVSPRVIPQLRDASEVMARIVRRPGTAITALVPNLVGAQRALDAGVDGLHFVLAATETYNQRNVGMSRSESLEQLSQIVALSRSRVATDGSQIPVAATIAVAFGCPFEGQVSAEALLALAGTLVSTGVDELGLADTAGLGQPLLVRYLIRRVQEWLPTTPLRMHFHDTRGLGLANAMAALECGIDTFDTSFAGLGGCPIMRGASGNIATEDFVNLCNELGLETGVDLDLVRVVSREMKEFLGRALPSRVLTAGTRAEMMAKNR